MNVALVGEWRLPQPRRGIAWSVCKCLERHSVVRRQQCMFPGFWLLLQESVEIREEVEVIETIGNTVSIYVVQ